MMPSIAWRPARQNATVTTGPVHRTISAEEHEASSRSRCRCEGRAHCAMKSESVPDISIPMPGGEAGMGTYNAFSAAVANWQRGSPED